MSWTLAPTQMDICQHMCPWGPASDWLVLCDTDREMPLLGHNTDTPLNISVEHVYLGQNMAGLSKRTSISCAIEFISLMSLMTAWLRSMSSQQDQHPHNACTLKTGSLSCIMFIFIQFSASHSPYNELCHLCCEPGAGPTLSVHKLIASV